MKVNVKNPIARVVLITLSYISVVIILVPAITYAIVRRVCNLEYYEKWYKFIANLKKYL